MMMRVPATVAALFACLASPAFATGEIVCSNGKGVSVDLLVGHIATLYVDRAIIEIGDKTWTTQPNQVPGTEISVGQGFEDDRQLLVDFTEANAGAVIGRLRVVKASEGDRSASGGTFSLKGEGAWVVDCSEPE